MWIKLVLSTFSTPEDGVGNRFYRDLDNPENFGPEWHLGVESQMPWLRIQDALPQVRCKDSPGLIAAWAGVGLEVE